jgi:hypothetical protein
MKKGTIRRGLAAIALAAIIVPVMAGSANAISPLPITCTAAGTVTFVNGTPDAWSVSGRGSCQGDLEGTYFLDFSGTGTSSTVGLCDEGLIVTNLDISVVGTLTNAQTLVPKFIAHTWSTPLTTYPLITPFLVSETGSGDLIGAGNFFNHIFLLCTGPTVAQFEFAFLT